MITDRAVSAMALSEVVPGRRRGARAHVHTRSHTFAHCRARGILVKRIKTMDSCFGIW